MIVLYIASSGIAAELLFGRQTFHSCFKIPLKLNESSTTMIKGGSDDAALIWQARLIIWDKVPMQSKCCFEAVDQLLQNIRDNNNLFGGIPAILRGD